MSGSSFELDSEAPKLEASKQVLKAEPSKLIERIEEDFTELFFYPEEDSQGEGDVRDIRVKDVEITDLKAVSLGDLECAVASDATVCYSAYVSYDDPESVIQDSSENFSAYLRKREGTVDDFTEMSGAVKLRFDSSCCHSDVKAALLIP